MSRRNRNAVIGIAIFLVILLAVIDHFNHEKLQPYISSKATNLNSSDIPKYHGKKVTVMKVVDGDTFDIDIPDGKFSHTRIRLWGVDTPETKNSPKGQKYFGQESADFVKELVLNKEVTVFLDEGADDNREKYGRLLAYVQLDDGRFLNEVLLLEGYAYADSRFRHSFYNKYKQLEACARSLEKGLWKDVTPDQMPQWKQKILKRSKLI